MTIPLDPKVAAEMRTRAQAVRDRMNSGGSFIPTWSLSGKNAIVQPGLDVIVRLAPRWDYASSLILQGDKRVPNPDYQPGFQFVVAYEHWYDVDGGKRTREWCPRTFDVDAWCPICVAASAMKASALKEDRDFGKSIEAHEVFIYNAVVGDPRRIAENGLADIRPVSCPGTIFNQISDIMTGGDKEQFARGDITNPREGYDLAFKRPPASGGERWGVQVAGVATPMYGPAQATAFKGWVTRLVDLDEMVRKEMKTPEMIFKAFYGRDPSPDEVRGGVARGGAPASGTGAESAATAPSATPPTAPDDDFTPSLPVARPATALDDDDFMPPPVGGGAAPKLPLPAGVAARQPPVARPAARGRR